MKKTLFVLVTLGAAACGGTTGTTGATGTGTTTSGTVASTTSGSATHGATTSGTGTATATATTSSGTATATATTSSGTATATATTSSGTATATATTTSGSGTATATTSGGSSGTCAAVTETLNLPDGGDSEPNGGQAIIVWLGADGGAPRAIIVADSDNDFIDVTLSAGPGAFDAGIFDGGLAPYALDDGGLDGITPIGLAWGDFNGDQINDIVFAGYDLEQVGVMLGKGDGTFGAPQYYAATDAGGDIYFPAVADMNKDGILDIVIGNEDEGTVAVLYGSDGGNGARGTFQTPYIIGLPGDGGATETPEPYGVALADFNADGNPDIVATDNSNNEQLIFIPGLGAAGFGAPIAFGGQCDSAASDDCNEEAYHIVAAHLRGPGSPWDLVAANTDNASDAVTGAASNSTNMDDEPTLDVFLGLADAGTGQTVPGVPFANVANYFNTNSVDSGDWTGQFSEDYTDVEDANWVAVVDVNGDGIPDLITAYHDYVTITQIDLDVWLGNGTSGVGNGTFTEAPYIVSSTTAGDDDSMSIAVVTDQASDGTQGGVTIVTAASGYDNEGSTVQVSYLQNACF